MVITRKEILSGRTKKVIVVVFQLYGPEFGVKFFGGLKIAVVFFSQLAEKVHCTTTKVFRHFLQLY